MLYLCSLVLFFGLHAIPMTPKLREACVDRYGEKRYRAMFRLAIIACVVMGYWGWSDFPYIPLYQPSIALTQLHLGGMLLVVYLWVAAETPNNLKRFLRHPMLTGMVIWSLGHMLANGDLRSLILFSSTLVFSIIAMMVANRRGDSVSTEVKPLKNDVMVVCASLLLYSVVAYFHEQLFGMPVIGYFLV